MDARESDASAPDETDENHKGTEDETPDAGASSTDKPAPSSDDAGYHTPDHREPKIVASPSSPFDEGYSEDMIMSDEELVDYIEDDDDDEEGEDDNFDVHHLPRMPLRAHKRIGGIGMSLSSDDDEGEADDNDADDESEVDRSEHGTLPANENESIAQPGVDPTSPGTRRHRRSLTRRAAGGRDSSTSSRSHLIRYIRSKVGKPSSEHTGANPMLEGTVSPDQIDIDDSSTSEDSYEDESSDSSWEMGGGPFRAHHFQTEPIVWTALPSIPQQFLENQAGAPPYLDASLLDRKGEISEMEANRCIMEHSLFLQAVLQLLGERDQVGVEGSMDSSHNIWKQGPLKKRSAGVGRRRSRPTSKWKVKYVELRKGNLCYYEDSGTSGGRKIVHLRQSDTVVHEVVSKASGFVFEVAVQGYPSRVWMASSEEERQAWIKAIQAAMIGETDSYRELDLRSHQDALDLYLFGRRECMECTEFETYNRAVQKLAAGETGLRVPMQWVRDAFPAKTKDLGTPTNYKESKSRRAPYRLLKTSIHQFWTKLSQTSFVINGSVIPHASATAAERTLGGLTRCILEYDQAFVPESDDEKRNLLTELQAVSYARDILMSTLRSKDREDSVCAVTNLLQNSDLIVIDSHPEEPVNLEVSWTGEDIPEESAPPGTSSDKSGWLRTRTKAGSKWRKRYAVLSGSVLSYYEAALPRPHGLLGQVVFESVSVVDKESNDENMFVLSIMADEKRLLAFDNEEECSEWRDAIETTIEACIPTLATTPSGSLSKSLLKGAERVIKGAIPGDSIRGGIRAIKGAKDGGIKVIRSAKDGGIKVIRGGIRGARGILRPSRQTDDEARQRRIDMKKRPSMQMLMNNAPADKRDPTVQCVAQATRVFDISEKGTNEVLFSVRSKLFQAFLLSGGVNGQISKGDALIELEFFGVEIPPDHDHFLEKAEARGYDNVECTKPS